MCVLVCVGWHAQIRRIYKWRNRGYTRARDSRRNSFALFTLIQSQRFVLLFVSFSFLLSTLLLVACFVIVSLCTPSPLGTVGRLYSLFHSVFVAPSLSLCPWCPCCRCCCGFSWIIIMKVQSVLCNDCFSGHYVFFVALPYSFFFFFELFNCFCFLACNLMPRFYLFHFPAAAAPHCTLSLSLSHSFSLNSLFITHRCLLGLGLHYTDIHLVLPAGVLVPELLPHPDDR